MTPASGPGVRLRDLALLGTTCVVCLLAAEQAYRFYLFGWDSLSVEKMNSLHDFGVSGLVQASDDPELVFELKSNLDTYFKLARLVTNSRGEADREYSLAKPDGTYRIAVVGDSFTMPTGVPLEAAFHTLLEERLNAPGARTSFEVINLAVAGYNLRQYWALIEGKALAYDPDLILVGFCARNDHRAFRRVWFERPYEPRPIERSFFSSFVVQGVAVAGRSAWRADTSSAKVIRRVRRKADIVEYLGRMGTLSRSRELPILLAYLDVTPKRMPFLETMLDSEGIDFVNVALEFTGRDLRDYTIHRLDSHPNAAAHEIFADRIYDHLRGGVLATRGPPDPAGAAPEPG